MTIERDIKLCGTEEFLSAVYNEVYFTKADSDVKIYDRYKISILLTSSVAAIYNGQIINVGKNGILFFRPDEIHFGRFLQSGTHKYLDFYIPVTFFDTLFKDAASFDFFEDRTESRINYISSELAAEKIGEISASALECLKNASVSTDAELFSLIMQAVILCDKLYGLQKAKPLADETPAAVSETLEYISENYASKLSLRLLSKNVNCSVTYLSKVFKQYTGKTVYGYLTEVRIKNAQLMLKHGSSVTEACFCSGFDDCSNFINTFKRLVGNTPMRYKAENMQ